MQQEPEESFSAPQNVEEDVTEEMPKDPEKPKVPVEFTLLAIEDFSKMLSTELGEQARLYVALNRNDVMVRYQWQILPIQNVEASEILFDYTNSEDTSYFFPYADINEAELLELNPDAVWPGIEMYWSC